MVTMCIEINCISEIVVDASSSSRRIAFHIYCVELYSCGRAVLDRQCRDDCNECWELVTPPSINGLIASLLALVAVVPPLIPPTAALLSIIVAIIMCPVVMSESNVSTPPPPSSSPVFHLKINSTHKRHHRRVPHSCRSLPFIGP